MVRGELLFDGNVKQVYATDDPEMVLFHFKDVATAFNNVKKAVFPNKGIVDNKISSYIFEYLKRNGVSTHYVEMVNDREQLCRKICIIPLELVVRNYIAGSIADKLGIEDGTKAQTVIYDLYYNNDALGDPMINDSEAVAIGLVSFKDLEIIYSTARKINGLLLDLFGRAGIKLVDLKLEFGKTSGGEIIVSDEISPDTCRFWDSATDNRLDKDRFRLDLGNIVASYEVVLDRLESLNLE
jgi:phosphoribosylaminoimidazole-succinocarboxamide synthase